MTIKEIALELLKKYEEAETSVIWELSGDMTKDEVDLRSEVEEYKNRLRVQLSSQSERWRVGFLLVVGCCRKMIV